MFPELDIGPVHTATYAAAYATALFVSMLFAFHRLRRLGVDPDQALWRLPIFFAFVLGGVLFTGGILLLMQRLTTGDWPSTVGLSALGIAAGAAVGGYWLARTTHRPVGSTLDALTPVWPLFLAIGRLGCFAAGCCWGKETDSWFGVHLRNVHGDWATRYPTQLMSAGANFAIFVGLLAFERYAQHRHRRSWPFNGFLFVLYIFCASLERFVLEWLRGDAIPAFGAWTWIHITTAGGMVVAVMIVLWYFWRLQQLAKEVTLPNQGNGRIESHQS